MFRKIPTILSAEEILGKAFRRMKKIEIPDRNVVYKHKKTIIARTESFTMTVTASLERYVREFPSIDNLPMFYQDLIDIKIDVNKLKKSLGAVDWARKTSLTIYSKQAKSLKKSKNVDFLKQKQKEIQGRISSVVNQVDKELQYLGEARDVMRKFPEIIQDIPTVVIAGYPNVGKSSLLRCLSAATPKVAQYPFTTKEIYIGHIERTERYIKKRYQIIDTPGLLDRPLSRKNDIERQAIAALNHLADLIIFILDPSDTCGYSLDDQKKLLSQIKDILEDVPVIVVENKADLKKTRSKNIKISSNDGSGVDILIDEIFSFYQLEE